MKRSILLLSLTLVVFSAISQSSFTNVVVVLADDIGLGDISSIRRAYRDQNWKLIIQSNKVEANEAIALFDLSTNPSESEAENLISDPKYQSRVRKMYRAYNKTRNKKLLTGRR